MKKIITTTAIVLVGMMCFAQQSAEELLDEAIYQEEVIGDLNKALNLYNELIKSYPDNRRMVAQAMYRSGYANEKLGNKKAVEYYRNVIIKYSDQRETVSLAQKRLKLLETPKTTDKNSNDPYMAKIHSKPGFFIGRLSPDGKHFSFYEDLNLYIENIGTSRIIPVTTEGQALEIIKNADVAVWSNDSKKLAFDWHESDKGYSLKIYNLIDGSIKTVVEPSEFIWPLEWTKNNTHILTISGNQRTDMQLGLLNLSSGEHKMLLNLNTKGIPLACASISPDMQHILYLKPSEQGDADIWLYTINDGKSAPISEHGANEIWMQWSNDGDSFVFLSDRSGAYAVYKWEFANGQKTGKPSLLWEGISNKHSISHINDEGNLILSSRFSQSNIKIANVYIERGELYEEKVIFEGASNLMHPRFSPNGNTISMIRRNQGKDNDELLVYTLRTGDLKAIRLGFDYSGNRWFAPFWTFDGKIQLLTEIWDEKMQSDVCLQYIVDPDGGAFLDTFTTYTPAIQLDQNRMIYTNHLGHLVLSNSELLDEIVIDQQVGSRIIVPNPKYKWGTYYRNVANGEEQAQQPMLLDFQTMEIKELAEPGWYISTTFRPNEAIINKVIIDEKGLGARTEALRLNLETFETTMIPSLYKTKIRPNTPRYHFNPTLDKAVYIETQQSTNIWELKLSDQKN